MPDLNSQPVRSNVFPILLSSFLEFPRSEIDIRAEKIIDGFIDLSEYIPIGETFFLNHRIGMEASIVPGIEREHSPVHAHLGIDANSLAYGGNPFAACIAILPL